MTPASRSRWYGTFLMALSFVGLALAYAAGRLNLAHEMRGALTLRIARWASPIPPGPPEDAAASETWSQLDALLDQRLHGQAMHDSRWGELLATSNPADQQRIVGELRARFLGLLRPWPGPQVDLDPQRQAWFSTDEIEVSLIRLQVYPGLRILCALLEPRGRQTPRPALLVLHGFDGNLQRVVADIDYHHGFGMDLARRGFVVLAPLRVTASVEAQSRFQIKSLAGGWTFEAVELWQLARAVDFLVSLPQVDRHHVGVYGISFGGQHALRLGAIDERLSLVVCSGYFTKRLDWTFNRFPLTPSHHVNVLPDMGVLLDDVNLVALVQPRFFGVESGTADPRHDAAASAFADVARLYQHAGYPDRARFMAFRGGHETSVATVAPFLEQWLATPFSREAPE